MRLKMMGGGDSVDYDALTATVEDVPEKLVFIGSGSDEEQVGTLPDRKNMHGAPGYSETNRDIPVHQAVMASTTQNTNGETQVVFVPPRGKYPGDSSAFVGCSPSDIGVTPAKVANGQTAAGVKGTYGADGDLTSADLREGKTGYGKNGKVSGGAVDYGSVSKTLAAGESYTINKGFYGAGKVTAKDLASQTDGDATAADILSGLKAWVKGELLTGSMADKSDTTQSATASLDATNSRLQMTVPAAGKYSIGSKLYAAYSTIRTLIGLTADKLWTDTTILGLSSSRSGLAAKTYTPGTSDQTIASGICLTGAQTIKGDSNLIAANIRKNKTIFGKTGTWYGNKKAIAAVAVRGYGASSSDYTTSEESSFTMPEDGIVYYGGFSSGYGSTATCTCEIYKNGTLVDSRNITKLDYMWRATMVNKSFATSAGDVIKVKCTATSGTCACAIMQAVIVY